MVSLIIDFSNIPCDYPECGIIGKEHNNKKLGHVFQKNIPSSSDIVKLNFNITVTDKKSFRVKNIIDHVEVKMSGRRKTPKVLERRKKLKNKLIRQKEYRNESFRKKIRANK